ncbi:hypothetical protein EC973_001045 [Apophysomyces ossiformis]|uniref:Bromodomain-containing protein n=1 Tax=Apophysomyces ossiformis TaxID=679940 RepID=A0A8H7BYL3_9FUNG|nr:hypothetical protein EC973_001045 [Apophysomyces ossiformis]
MSLSPDKELTKITRDQTKYCLAIMRNLKKHRDAAPFRQPVDYIKSNVPDYPKIIKQPMDLDTVDSKLSSGAYRTVDEMVADVRLVFSNCYKFNGPEATISMLCQNVEFAFEKSLKQMPPSEEVPRVASDGQLTNTSNPVPLMSRPKRDVQAPRSKGQLAPGATQRAVKKNDNQMKFCMQTLRELKRAKYRDINYPFLAPVDIVTLNIPDYPSIVKRPMDLSTIETKLIDGSYESPESFEADIRLMFNNCYLYNPPTTPVHKMGKELEKVFDEKWKQRSALPKPSQQQPSHGKDHDAIARLERDLVHLSQKVAHIKSGKKGEKRTAKQPRTVSSTSSTGSKTAQKNKRRRTSSAAKLSEDLPDFSFEQKKELSEKINNLSSNRMNTVLQIIQSSMPNLDKDQDEIELDIDSLDRATLHRLHDFVTKNNSVSPKTKQTTKRPRQRQHSAPSNQEVRTVHSSLDYEGNGKPFLCDPYIIRSFRFKSCTDSDSSSGNNSDTDSGSGSNDSETSDSDA